MLLHVLLAKSIGMSGQMPFDEPTLPSVPEPSPGPFIPGVEEPTPTLLELDPSGCRLPTLTFPPHPLGANTIVITALAAN
jgi:hypothetical protein